MATSTIKCNQIINELTLPSAVSGGGKYIQEGNVITFSAILNINASLSNGYILASGFPKPYAGNTAFHAQNNNSTTETITLILNSVGNLVVKGAQTSANRSIRVSGSYVRETN